MTNIPPSTDELRARFRALSEVQQNYIRENWPADLESRKTDAKAGGSLTKGLAELDQMIKVAEGTAQVAAERLPVTVSHEQAAQVVRDVFPGAENEPSTDEMVAVSQAVPDEVDREAWVERFRMLPRDLRDEFDVAALLVAATDCDTTDLWSLSEEQLEATIEPFEQKNLSRRMRVVEACEKAGLSSPAERLALYRFAIPTGLADEELTPEKVAELVARVPDMNFTAEQCEAVVRAADVYKAGIDEWTFLCAPDRDDVPLPTIALDWKSYVKATKGLTQKRLAEIAGCKLAEIPTHRAAEIIDAVTADPGEDTRDNVTPVTRTTLVVTEWSNGERSAEIVSVS